MTQSTQAEDREASDTFGSRFLLPLVFAGLFFGALFLLDFPKPGLDDLFFVGTPLNLAQGGDYSNPLIERQQFPSHFYFVHPPTYSYALAGWLKVFGISASSMLGFELLMYLLICVATMAILNRNRAPVLLAWLVPLGVAAAFLPEGLRPESFCVALTLCGFALIHTGRTQPVFLFIAFFLIALGGSSAERLIFFSAALVVAAILDLRKQGCSVVRALTFAGSAGLVVCAMLLYLIHFKVAEFWNTFHFTAAGRTGHGLLASFIGVVRHVSVVQWPVILLWFACLPLLLVQVRERQLGRLAWLLLGAWFVTALVSGSGHGVLWYIILMLLFFCVAGVNPPAGKLTVYLPVLVAGVLLLANTRNFIYAAGMLSGKIQSDKGGQVAEAQALRSTPEHPVLIDSETARYVFNYQLPANSLDWSFSSRFPGSLPTDDPLRPGDIYLVGPSSVNWLNLKTHLHLQLPIWKPLGPAKTFDEFPRRAYVIRPQQCGEMTPR